jgi:uncharacterized membrane protein YeaQ/YmgE (transglycosylase-associated protein family)
VTTAEAGSTREIWFRILDPGHGFWKRGLRKLESERDTVFGGVRATHRLRCAVDVGSVVRMALSSDAGGHVVAAAPRSSPAWRADAAERAEGMYAVRNWGAILALGGMTMHLSNQSLLVVIVVGIVAGYLAGKVMRGGGFGLIGDLVVGLIGAFIGDWLLPRLGIHLGVGIVALIVNALIGAIILLLILRLVGGSGFRGRWGRRW